MCRLAQAYIDNLKATGQCEDGVICGLDGTVGVPGGGGTRVSANTPLKPTTTAKIA